MILFQGTYIRCSNRVNPSSGFSREILEFHFSSGNNQITPVRHYKAMTIQTWNSATFLTWDHNLRALKK